MTGVEKLLKKAGSATAAAAALTDDERTCSRQVIEHWKNQGYVPGKWAPAVNRVFGIPLHELNPTIYPKSAA